MSTAATPATFATLYGPEGRIDHAFLTEAGVNISIRSAHHVIVSMGSQIPAPKIRKQFGHAVTQTTAKAMKSCRMPSSV